MELEFNEELMKNEILINQHANQLMNETGVQQADAWGHMTFASNDDHVDPKEWIYFTYCYGAIY